MPIEEQVISIYIGINGYCDDMPLQDINRFEEHTIRFLKLHNIEILKSIEHEKAISSKTEADLKNALEKIVKTFV
jgi:F-type H+-transporting ATPase subunit alpha